MHPTPAERLLSMLEEQGAVEALPAGEVREELAALGVDPARSIAFARSLAHGGDSPGRRLMAALLAGEEEDGEIARIESTGIEEVRAGIPEAAAAGIAAEARRKAGIGDNVVGLAERRRKRRRRLIAWGGPLAGVAASGLVVVIGLQFLSTQMQIVFNTTSSYLSSAASGPGGEPQDIEAKQPAGKPYVAKEKSTPEADLAAPAEEMLTLNESTAPTATPDKKSVAPTEAPVELKKLEQFAAAPPPAASARSGETPDDVGRTALPDNLDGVAADGEAEIATDNEPGAPARRSNDAPTLPGIVAPPSGNFAAERFRAETEIAAAPAADGDTAIAGANRAEISGIAAVLVLDPSQAPLQVQSPILPPGGLADRVEEARRLAGDRPVIALYTIATGPARRDFAQVPLRPGLTQQFAAPSPMVGLLGVEATEYDFIALPIE